MATSSLHAARPWDPEESCQPIIIQSSTTPRLNLDMKIKTLDIAPTKVRLLVSLRLGMCLAGFAICQVLCVIDLYSEKTYSRKTADSI
jgi:hypothetical protein